MWLALIKAVPVTFTALMPVINPIGTAIILLGMTEGADERTRRALAKAIAVNTVLLLTVLLLAGSYVLSFFGISIPVVQAAGGVVLASMGWNLLNAKEVDADSRGGGDAVRDSQSYFAKSFYPYTFPITVGPGCIAVILTLSAHTTHGNFVTTAVGKAGAFIGIVAIAVLVYLLIAYSDRLKARLGPSGTVVVMRLIAFIVVCIGAEISWSGISALLSQLPALAHGAVSR